MPEVAFLADECIGPSLFSACFRNGTVVRTGEDDDGRVLTLLYVSRNLYAVETRHVDVHQHQVWQQHRDITKCLASIGCGANEIEITGCFEDLGQDFQHERRIVHHQGCDSGLRYVCPIAWLGIHDHGLSSPMKKWVLFS